MVGIVGLDVYQFPLFPSPIIAGIEFDGDASLPSGENLPRTCRGCAASAGFDVEDIQRFVTLVVQNELVHHLRPFHHRLECE